MDWVWVALGGAIGASARHAAQVAAARLGGAGSVWGTLCVNVLGCFAIGLLYPQLHRLPAVVRPLVVVGLLGGLTTMSGYAIEVVSLAQQGRWAIAGAYAGCAVIACVACAGGGLWVAGKLVSGA